MPYANKELGHKLQRKRWAAYYATPEGKRKERIRKQAQYLKHKDRINARNKNYYRTHLDKTKERTQRYAEQNPARRAAIRKRFRERHLERARKSCREWYAKNRERVVSAKVVRNRERYASDILYRLAHNLRQRVRTVTSPDRKEKNGAFSSLFGCDRPTLRQWLESQFKEGMTWGNYGPKGWHIDHVRPIASFDLSNPHHRKQCFYYINLQPLWWRDNLSKQAKWEEAA